MASKRAVCLWCGNAIWWSNRHPVGDWFTNPLTNQGDLCTAPCSVSEGWPHPRTSTPVRWYHTPLTDADAIAGLVELLKELYPGAYREV